MTNSVVWSNEALEEFIQVYDFWIKKNTTSSFSDRLWHLTDQAIFLIRRNPNLGVPTNVSKIRMRLIYKHYYLIYKIEIARIEILKFWDVRQSPSKNKFIEY